MLAGTGSQTTILTEEQVFDICSAGFSQKQIDGKKLLVIIPDHTRTAPIDVMFRVLNRLLAPRVELLDFLVALGTHPPMSDEAINRRVGITAAERTTKYPKARFFNHHWKDQNQLQIAGTITADQIAEISGGLMRQPVDVTINKMVYDYDLLLIV